MSNLIEKLETDRNIVIEWFKLNEVKLNPGNIRYENIR